MTPLSDEDDYLMNLPLARFYMWIPPAQDVCARRYPEDGRVIQRPRHSKQQNVDHRRLGRALAVREPDDYARLTNDMRESA